MQERLNYLRDKYKVNENDFLTFDAMRQAAQCAGRVIRGKTDYGYGCIAQRKCRADEETGKSDRQMLTMIMQCNHFRG